MSDQPTTKQMIDGPYCPRQYAFVKFDMEGYDPEIQGMYQYPFKLNKRYTFLGEIPNMPGHCIVMDSDGKTFTGFHTENFVELTFDEVDTFLP
jgi:hypothetical protein